MLTRLSIAPFSRAPVSSWQQPGASHPPGCHRREASSRFLVEVSADEMPEARAGGGHVRGVGDELVMRCPSVAASCIADFWAPATARTDCVSITTKGGSPGRRAHWGVPGSDDRIRRAPGRRGGASGRHGVASASGAEPVRTTHGKAQPNFSENIGNPVTGRRTTTASTKST